MLAMFNPLELPRALWKAGLVFTMLAAIFICLIVQQWPHRQDDLAIARWTAWLSIVIGVFNLPRMMVVAVPGRFPKAHAQMSGRLNRTLPQIHADISRERQEPRERSRGL